MSKHVTNFPLIMTLEGNKIAIDSKTFKTEGRIEVGMPPQGTQGLAGRVDGGFIGAVDIDDGERDYSRHRRRRHAEAAFDWPKRRVRCRHRTGIWRRPNWFGHESVHEVSREIRM